MKRTLAILLYLSATLVASGQYLRLAGDPSSTALYFDPIRIWNYNLYEHSRWGGGLLLSTHPKRFIFSRLDAGAYIGYGTYDKQWKFGLGLDEYMRNSAHHSVHYQRAMCDYTAAGSRHIANPWNDSQLLGAFMARRMTREHSFTLGHRWNTDSWYFAVELTLGERGWLFDDKRLIYIDRESVGFESFGRLRLLLRHRCGFSTQLDLMNNHTVRLLADYRHDFPISLLNLQLYTQGGFTPKNAEYVDMFDLGGTWGSPLYLNNSLTTALPNEFTANAFTLLSMRLQTAKPLYQVYSTLFSIGSNPYPFVGLTAAWGIIWEQDADGQRPWLNSYLQAPYQGILEPSIGINGIIRWGVADWGIALTYRLTPSSASYHGTSTADNLTFLITAVILP